MIIDILLSEKGQNLLGKKHHKVIVESEEEIEKTIPSELIESYTTTSGGLVNLEPGDLVKVINRDCSSEIQEVKRTTPHWIYVSGLRKFDYTGEGYRKGRIEIPTESDIQEYREGQSRGNLIQEIEALIERENLYNLKTEDLEEILRIIKEKD